MREKGELANHLVNILSMTESNAMQKPKRKTKTKRVRRSEVKVKIRKIRKKRKSNG